MEQNTDAIRQEIERTRERLGGTVEAIAYKSDVPARAKDAVNERIDAAKDAVSNAVGTARQVFAGAASTARSTVADARDAVAGAGAAAGDVVANASDAVATAGDAVANASERVVSAAQSRADAVDARSLVARYPLGVAAGTFAAGLLIGLVLPVSDLERRQVGPVGEELSARAKAAAGDLVAQAANQAANAAAQWSNDA